MNCVKCKDGYETVYGHPGGANYGTDADGNAAGTGRGLADCLDPCSSNQYRDFDYSCQACPNCCQSGCELISGTGTQTTRGQLRCLGLVAPDTFDPTTNSCGYDTPTGGGEDPEITIAKSGDQEFTITLNQGSDGDVELGTHVTMTIGSLKSGEDYSLELVKVNTGTYKLSYTIITDANISETAEIAVTTVKNFEGTTYPEVKFFEIINRVKPAFGVSEETAKTVSSASKSSIEFGVYLQLLLPKLSTIFHSLNMAQLIALYPVLLPVKLMAFMKLIVSLEGENFTTSLMDSAFYDLETRRKKLYFPRNTTFKFTAIYSRARSMKIIMRVLLNLFFYLVFVRKIFSKKKEELSITSKSSSTSSSSGDTPRPLKKVSKYSFIELFLLKMLIGLNHANIPINLIYLMSSIAKG